MPTMKPENDDRQTVRGTVISGDRVAVVKTGPIKIGDDGRAEAEVIFDRPVSISLGAVFSPEDMQEINEVLGEIADSESNRFDDLVAITGMDVTRDLVGMDFPGSEFIGTPDRPLDLRGWNLTGCDLSEAIFEHVLVDEKTNVKDANLTGIHGPDAHLILALPSCNYDADYPRGLGI